LRLLLDENLSPRLVGRLAALDIYAAHVAHLGLSGYSDPALFRYAYENDLAVITIDAADFLSLASPLLVLLHAMSEIALLAEHNI
jgi:predicted nuclease of predicted toxin-antitoxin system